MLLKKVSTVAKEKECFRGSVYHAIATRLLNSHIVDGTVHVVADGKYMDWKSDNVQTKQEGA